MKYNPKINEDMARVAGFGRCIRCAGGGEPGALELLHDLAGMLAEIAGMDAVSLQPAAGAQGELAGVLMIRAYHASRREADEGPHPGLGPRNQSRLDGDRRLRGHRGEVRRQRRGRPG